MHFNKLWNFLILNIPVLCTFYFIFAQFLQRFRCSAPYVLQSTVIIVKIDNMKVNFCNQKSDGISAIIYEMNVDFCNKQSIDIFVVKHNVKVFFYRSHGCGIFVENRNMIFYL